MLIAGLSVAIRRMVWGIPILGVMTLYETSISISARYTGWETTS